MNVNFTVFIDKILSGEKRQTIRKAGKKWDKVKVGDKLTLYTGLRTKDCRKLGEAEVKSIEDIRIETKVNEKRNVAFGKIYAGKRKLDDGTISYLAELDGFKSTFEFLDFFNAQYGEHFKGKIIKWKNFRKAEE